MKSPTSPALVRVMLLALAPLVVLSSSALPTTTDTKSDLYDQSILPPIVAPLEWSGGPIDAKVLLIGNHLNYDSRYSYAIIDLFGKSHKDISQGSSSYNR